MSANGDVMVGEMRLRADGVGADTPAAELDSVLGTAWDEALEPFRGGSDTAEATWLSGVGSRGANERRMVGRRIFSAPGTADTSTGSGQANSPSA